MAMRPALFTISGLATELGIDRRTVAQRLAGVAPDGKSGRHDAWRLQTVLPMLIPPKAGEQPASSAARPIVVGGSGFDSVNQLEHPFHQGVALAALWLIYRAGAYAACAAVDAGASCRVAYAMAPTVTLAMMESLQELTSGLGIPFAREEDDGPYDLNAFFQVNWRQLAKEAGEPFAEKEWKAYQHRTAVRIEEGQI